SIYFQEHKIFWQYCQPCLLCFGQFAYFWFTLRTTCHFTQLCDIVLCRISNALYKECRRFTYGGPSRNHAGGGRCLRSIPEHGFQNFQSARFRTPVDPEDGFEESAGVGVYPVSRAASCPPGR